MQMSLFQNSSGTSLWFLLSEPMYELHQEKQAWETNKQKSIGDRGFVHSSRDHIKIETETQSKQQVKSPGI